MSFRFSLKRFPESAAVKDACGLPWGAVVQPFVYTTVAPCEHVENVARCDSCYAYINPYCGFYRGRWACSLCGEYNAISSRYVQESDRARLPELRNTFVEYVMGDVDAESDLIHEQPLYVAVVDLSGTPEYVEAVKRALIAMMEGAHPRGRLGLLTVSDRLGVYDLGSSVPHVKHVLVPPDGDMTVTLEEVATLPGFTVEVGLNKDTITKAINSLHSTMRPGESPDTARRAFGSAVQAVMEFVGLYETLSSGRMLCFLAGMPNYGAGALRPRKSGESARKSALQPRSAFYRDMATHARSVGLCVDLFVVNDSEVDLATLRALPEQTGGNVFRYPSLTHMTMDQDVFRHVQCPQASQCLFRIRTTPEFKADRMFGHMMADESYDNLYHMVGCDMHKTVAFDFSFTTPSGFTGDVLKPTLQLAFAYNVATRDAEAKRVVQRRLRVHTIRMSVAPNPLLVYQSADPDIVTHVLTHKIVRACVDKGVLEGRLLLQDWMIILLAHYNTHAAAPNSGAYSANAVDFNFTQVPALHFLPRYVYALLQSPLLRMEGVRLDERIHLQSLFGALEPHNLLRALYPALSAYNTPDQVLHPSLPLARSALQAGGAIFMLDAFHSVMLYYTDANAQNLIPPEGSELRKAVDGLKQFRHLSPRILCIRRGSPEEYAFAAHLIEDQSEKVNFVAWCNEVVEEVKNFIS